MLGTLSGHKMKNGISGWVAFCEGGCQGKLATPLPLIGEGVVARGPQGESARIGGFGGFGGSWFTSSS